MAKRAKNRKNPARKQVARRNPIARELREGGNFKPRVVRNKKRYNRKQKHRNRQNDDSGFSFVCVGSV